MAVARACGALADQIIRAAFAEARDVSIKGNRNIVTETDVAVERAVKALLLQEFPAHALLAEETAADERSEGWLWVCDPVDGTKNFAQGIPHFAFSLALCHAGVPQLGVITHPLLGWEFRAERGSGCRLNDHPVRVSNRTSLAESIVAIDLGFEDERGHAQLELSHTLWTQVQGIRTSGSAALGFAYVAAGKWDAYVHPKLSPWDSAAGLLLVSEAGGLATDTAGSPAGIWSEWVVAGTPAVQAELWPMAGAGSGRA